MQIFSPRQLINGLKSSYDFSRPRFSLFDCSPSGQAGCDAAALLRFNLFLRDHLTKEMSPASFLIQHQMLPCGVLHLKLRNN